MRSFAPIASKILALLFALLCATGCTAQGSRPQPAPTIASTPPPTQSPSATAEEAGFQNPILRADFPDPDIIQVDTTFYAYATNSSGKNIQAARSTDLVNWEILPDAMPALPAWARLGGSLVWAPEVIQIEQTFLLYYTARDKQSDRQCIGVATSTSPEGKFRDTRDTALVCQAGEGGSIDPSPFQEGEKHYLYWKNDGNCCGKRTYIYVQELAPDGLSLVGEPVQLLQNDTAWEGGVIEAPTMWKHAGRYYLFFSANDYASLKYAVGYATCESPSGPCQDSPDNPILETSLERPPVIGPGHQTIVELGGETWILYHAWEVSSAGVKTNRRFMWLDRLVWEAGVPDVLGPTTGTQPLPLLQMSP